MKHAKIILIAGSALLFLLACKTLGFRNNYRDFNQLIHESGDRVNEIFLKAHHANGDVYIFHDKWMTDLEHATITGACTHYDFNRNVLANGVISVPIDSVALFETNTSLSKVEHGRIGALTVLTAIDAGLGLFCATNPKACFGSCPTFYVEDRGDVHYADAEGFSNAILPSLEYADIDALPDIEPGQKAVRLTMKNEALETHCLRSIDLLAYPIEGDQRIFHSLHDEFYLCNTSIPVASAQVSGRDITSLVRMADKNEYYSASDVHDLNSKEEIFLTFDPVHQAGPLGLVLDFRQTLMTTYMIYSAMGYMGDEVSDLFARMDSEKKVNEKLKNGLKKELGNIDVFVKDPGGQWVLQDGFHETGPIAMNTQILPLSLQPGIQPEIKLVLNKGLWRIDGIALTHIVNKVQPIAISPDAVFHKGIPDSKLHAQLIDEDALLLSMPGDEYEISYTMPDPTKKYQVFLKSKGYYIEWMRESWLKDKDLLKLRQMVENPKRYLKSEAQNYKLYENTMEQQFWESRIDTKNFAYYEN